MTEELHERRGRFRGRSLPALDARKGAVIHLEGLGNGFEGETAGDPQSAQRGFGKVGHRAEILHHKQIKGQEIALGALNPTQNRLRIKGMHPGPTIRRLRKERDWRLEHLAEAVERHLGKPVNTGNLSRLERQAQGYSDDLLQAIAKALGVHVADLFKSDGVGEMSNDYTTAQQHEEPSLKIRRFDNRAGMGTGVERHEGDALVGHMTVSMKWVQQRLPNITSPRNLEIITGFGDSMAPTFADGDLMFVDRGVREVDTDNVYVFALDNKLFIKTLQRLPGGALKVISDNKKYDPYILEADSPHQIEILGRVVWAWNGRKL